MGLWYSKRQLDHTQSDYQLSGILHPVIEGPIPYLPPPYRYHTHSSATEHFSEEHQTLLKSGTVRFTWQIFFWQSERLSYTHSTELLLIENHPPLQQATARQLQPPHRSENVSRLVKVHYLSRYNLHQYTNQIVLRPANSFILSHSVYAKLAGAALI